MTRPDWTPLETELRHWRAAGLTLPLWWRDDDASAPSPALERLARLSERVDLPVHLAIIPQGASDALPAALTDRMIPVVHGWAHANHAPADAKKAEFGAHRPLAPMRAEAEAGLTRLRGLFGARLAPMFVPPWNRIDPALAATLSALGYRWLSTFTPRQSPEAAPWLTRINTHLDPIEWHGGRTLADPDALIAQIARQMADRRTNQADNDEPYGLLTHHLVHDAEIWDFTEALLSRLRAGPTRPWTALKGPRG